MGNESHLNISCALCGKNAAGVEELARKQCNSKIIAVQTILTLLFHPSLRPVSANLFVSKPCPKSLKRKNWQISELKHWQGSRLQARLMSLFASQRPLVKSSRNFLCTLQITRLENAKSSFSGLKPKFDKLNFFKPANKAKQPKRSRSTHVHSGLGFRKLHTELPERVQQEAFGFSAMMKKDGGNPL